MNNHLFTIETASLTDLPEIVHLENSVWSKNQRATADTLEERLHYFRDGFLIAKLNNKIIASFYAIQCQHYPGEIINWLHTSGNGSGRTHDASGNSLFSLSITVSRMAPKGTYRKMMQAWRKLGEKLNMQYIFAGSRLPGLSLFSGSPQDYLLKIKAGEIFDPILSKAKACHFSIGNLIPNYFADPASLNYGVEIFQTIK